MANEMTLQTKMSKFIVWAFLSFVTKRNSMTQEYTQYAPHMLA